MATINDVNQFQSIHSRLSTNGPARIIPAPAPPRENCTDRWPMPLEVREHIVQTALGLTGLVMTPDGKVERLPGPLPPPRIRTSAMRILASLDRISLQQNKVELLERKMNTSKPVEPKWPEGVDREVVRAAVRQAIDEHDAEREAALKTPGSPEAIAWEKKKSDLRRAAEAKKFRQRWPISPEVRGQIIATALCLCGFAVDGDGAITPLERDADTPGPNLRTVLAALRVLVAYDRLSLEERQVDLRIQALKDSQKDRGSGLCPIFAAKLDELIESNFGQPRT
jgi:hypothetical protein